MTVARPVSHTALAAAAARAAHLIVDGRPVIFADSLAAVVLGEAGEELIAYHRRHGEHLVLVGARTQATCRARYTEDRLAEAVARGVRQYVLLGAGLDTFAYRGGLSAGLRVFEVDHPATQAWKWERLAAAGLAAPDGLVPVPVDLATGALAAALATAGFDRAAPAVVSWLGVTMYLSATAIATTLDAVAGFAPGTELIFDVMLPPAWRDAEGQAYVDQVAPVAAQRGEPWRTLLSPSDVDVLLSARGFTSRLVGQRGMVPAEVWDRDDALRPAALAVIAHARLGRPDGSPRRAARTLA